MRGKKGIGKGPRWPVCKEKLIGNVLPEGALYIGKQRAGNLNTGRGISPGGLSYSMEALQAGSVDGGTKARRPADMPVRDKSSFDGENVERE